jgi:LysM repeat protein
MAMMCTMREILPARAIGVAVIGTALVARDAHPQTLRGSGASMDRQYAAAIAHDYSFLVNTRDVRHFVKLGLLVPVRGSASYRLSGVSFPYARPEVRTFVDRLASQYKSVCGEPLIVTSLTRPTARQPFNASSHSVHPTGMAVDLRVSRRTKCRKWLERTLLSLERSRVIEATRERMPAHYHIAVFPKQYGSYLARRSTQTHTTTVAVARTARYRVNRGDTLWSIARRHGTTVDELQELNGLGSKSIRAGQMLQLPGR